MTHKISARNGGISDGRRRPFRRTVAAGGHRARPVRGHTRRFPAGQGRAGSEPRRPCRGGLLPGVPDADPQCHDGPRLTPPSAFLQSGADSRGWIFDVNNSPLLAPARHPILRLALARATRQLLTYRVDRDVPVQSLTGPHNLTTSLVRHTVSRQLQNRRPDFAFITDWDDMASRRNSPSYRNDARNWRLWSRRPT